MLKKFISFYKPHRTLFFLDFFAAFLVAGCDLIYPMLTRNVINDIIPNKNLRSLVVFAVALLIIYIIKAGLNYFMTYYGHAVGVRMQADMRRDMFEHLQSLPCKYFDNNKAGVIMSRMINDLMEVSELAHHGPEDIFTSVVMIIGSLIVLCTINVPLTIIIFAFIPILLWFTMSRRKKMNDAFLETRVKTGEVNATLENSLAGVKVTKSFANEEFEMQKFQENNVKFKKAREYSYKVMGEYFAGMNFFTDLLDLLVLIGSGYFAYKEYISIGDLAAYILYIKSFMQPIKKLINFMEQYQAGTTGFKRYMEIIEEVPQQEKENTTELKNVKGRIDIENVSFSYDENNAQILENFNLSIEAGKMVALVGPSGGGKTTICNLIPRFYEFEEGRILIDGNDIHDVSLRSLRSNIGVVQQDVFLFTGTIKDNILYGSPRATDEEIIQAAKRASLHDFIMTLPNRYDTYVGERGVKLSGGQKQRISIARVFLKNPPILILDEATSALDNVTEYEIQQSLEELCKERTTLVVAHRLTTVKNADEIVVVTDKGIEERGTHEELMNLGGIYSGLNVMYN
ncbi:ABC transporter ATP-binding protein [Inconstantimicrobium mannanitabidum]|uniref:Multidrug ABC transporter ATP-binding protein n=1 Tax=Inconstantimicrobium mannanitabidum TaxID=1604901 RepID=A0ACB5RHK9_9CLOT|nr:ABC transporter ATP-binding protein [Clostridium sp. TW13]GKX68596.1 multidrug ABC transporter ATP-binding protein [Clostridium sp. TW13]